MQADLSNSTVTVIAAAHNPTIISDTFFIRSGIIKDVSEISRATTIITPAFSQVSFVNGSVFILETNSLQINNNTNDVDPFIMAEKYCVALPHITASALGINFKFTLEAMSLKEWFAGLNVFHFRTGGVQSIRYAFDNIANVCFVDVTRTGDYAVEASFNFHYALNSMPLADVVKKYEFTSEAKSNKTVADQFINEVFKQV